MNENIEKEYLKILEKNKKSKEEDTKQSFKVLFLEHIDLFKNGKLSEEDLNDSKACYEEHTGTYYDETLNEVFHKVDTDSPSYLKPFLILIGLGLLVTILSNLLN